MPFAADFRKSLQLRDRQVASELTRGDSLQHVLDRHLLTVERMDEGNILTSILLLSDDGKRLSHGAAPNLPQSYRDAIDGLEIGPNAGCCGTAAYFGRPVYVDDIATDPLWDDFRDLALPHRLRSCWSTPIRDDHGSIIGTFAVYHRTVGGPTTDEIDAINIIAAHVARAIMRARNVQDLEPASARTRGGPRLALVRDPAPAPEASRGASARLLQNLERLREMASELDSCAEASESDESSEVLKTAAEDFRTLADAIQRQFGPHDPGTSSKQ
jgi:GAF domain-containing protein